MPNALLARLERVECAFGRMPWGRAVRGGAGGIGDVQDEQPRLAADLGDGGLPALGIAGADPDDEAGGRELAGNFLADPRTRRLRRGTHCSVLTPGEKNRHARRAIAYCWDRAATNGRRYRRPRARPPAIGYASAQSLAGTSGAYSARTANRRAIGH